MDYGIKINFYSILKLEQYTMAAKKFRNSFGLPDRFVHILFQSIITFFRKQSVLSQLQSTIKASDF